MSLIVSKTPLRVSFFSGGDMEAFYKKEPGHCLSATVQLYIYITLLSQNSNDGLRFMHDTTEDVASLNDLKNDIARECLRYRGYEENFNFTIASMSDVKASGNGLGSSSAFTVGLLNSLWFYSHAAPKYKWLLAEQACDIEIRHCKHPIGKQDQYAAALGGLNFFTFDTDGSVHAESDHRTMRHLIDMSDHMVLVYSGISHKASDLLQKQNEIIMTDQKKFELLRANAFRARMGYELLNREKFNDFGELLHEAWLDKKAITDGISNPELDEIYDYALKVGATGGKILGAGGGGFFLFYFPYYAHRSIFMEKIRRDFPKCVPYGLEFTDHGSEVTEFG